MQGKFNEAIEMMNEAILRKSMNPQPKYYWILGNLYFYKGDYKEAIPLFKKVLKIDSKAKYENRLKEAIKRLELGKNQ